MLLGTLCTIFSQPLGPWLQAKVTSSPVVGTLHAHLITRYVGSNLPLHRVLLKS
jgi:hypothetical protein